MVLNPMRIYVQILSLCCLLSFNSLSFAQEIVLKGNLGPYPILMMLNISDNGITGRYAYDNQLVSIYLEGKDLNHLTEFKLPPEIDDWDTANNYVFEPNAVFNGAFTSPHFKGFWTSVDSKIRLAFNLTTIEDNRIDADSNSFFDYLIAKQIHFNPLAKETHHANGLITQHYQEPITQIINSRILNLGNNNGRENINQLLENNHKQAVELSIWCLSEAYINARDAVGYVMDHPDFETDFYHPPLLEISYSGSIYCGGAHPSNFYNITVIDTAVGHAIDLKSLFNIYQDDDETLSDVFKSILLRHIDQDKTNECLYEGGDVPNLGSLDFHLAFKENHIGVKYIGLGHAMFVCELDDIATIPVIELKSLARSDADNYFSVLK